MNSVIPVGTIHARTLTPDDVGAVAEAYGGSGGTTTGALRAGGRHRRRPPRGRPGAAGTPAGWAWDRPRRHRRRGGRHGRWCVVRRLRPRVPGPAGRPCRPRRTRSSTRRRYRRRSRSRSRHARAPDRGEARRRRQCIAPCNRRRPSRAPRWPGRDEGAPSHHEPGERLGAREEQLPGIEPSDHRQPLGPRVRPPQERETASRQSPGDRERLALARRVRGLGRIRGAPRGDHGLDIVTRAPDLPSATQRLIDAANENGGPDNVTCVIARWIV